MVGKGQLIGNIDDVASYTVPYNSTNILCRGPPGSSFLEEYVSSVKRPSATFVGTLNRWENVLTQLFTPGLLLSASRLKLLSLEVYHSRAEPWRDVAMLALTRIASRKVTRL